MTSGGKRILIVEDNPQNMELVRDLLNMKGYLTFEAENGEDGARMAREELPDLVLMDIQLPGISGIEATKIIKNDEKTKHIPVIAVTAHAMSGYRDELIGHGFDDYISKPIELRQLVAKVSEILS